MTRIPTFSTAADLAAFVRGARPDAAAVGIDITADWCRDQMHNLGVTRYEDVDEAILDAICEQVNGLAVEGADDYPTLSQDQLDAIAPHMDDAIREELHSARDWQSPGEFLTAYLSRDPAFPVHQFEAGWVVSEADDIAVAAHNVRPSRFLEAPGAVDVDVDIDLPSGRVSGVATVVPNPADPETYETAGSPDAWLSADVLAAIDALGLADGARRRLLTDISMAAAVAAEEVR